MSGGSYNYLCDLDDTNLLDKQDDLQRMFDRLDRLGYAKDAARETQELLLIIRQFQNRASLIADRLRDVWKSVEWWDSGDWGEDEVKKFLNKYRNES